MKNAYFAGGCFWCIAAEFEGLPGVAEVISGYAGGTEPNPAYPDVKKQKTAHRETIRIRYDEAVTSYDALLAFFLEHVDPFDAEGQFIDKGFSYTLALFYETEAEREVCQRRLAELEASARRKPCVSVLPFTGFYDAEEEHQHYAQKNPEAFQKEYEESGRKAYFEGRG